MRPPPLRSLALISLLLLIWIGPAGAGSQGPAGGSAPECAAHESALARAAGTPDYYPTLLAAAQAIADADGLEAALAWLGELAAWDPSRAEHHRALGSMLDRADRQDEAHAAFAAGAEAIQNRLQVGFDAQDHFRWDSLRAADPEFARALAGLRVMLASAAATAPRSAVLAQGAPPAPDAPSATSPDYAARSRSLTLRLAGEADPDAMPQQLEGGRKYSTRVLEQHLQEGHTSDRRLAAAMLVDKLAAGRINARRAHDVARVLLEEQLDPAKCWVPDMGDAFERLWARGALDRSEIEAYLSQALLAPVLELERTDESPVRYVLRGRTLPRVARAGGESPHALIASLDWTDARLDGAAVDLGGEQPGSPAGVELPQLHGGEPVELALALLPDAALPPGRHELHVTCLVMVEARSDGGPVALGGVPYALRIPFFVR